jgi:hypothetical protein
LKLLEAIALAPCGGAEIVRADRLKGSMRDISKKKRPETYLILEKSLLPMRGNYLPTLEGIIGVERISGSDRLSGVDKYIVKRRLSRSRNKTEPIGTGAKT